MNATESSNMDRKPKQNRGAFFIVGALSVALSWFLVDSLEAKIALLSLSVLVLLWPSVLPKGFGLAKESRSILIGLLASLMLFGAIRDDLDRFLSRGEVRVWNVYHYYLGAKYFRELGYTDLYPATLAADKEGAGYWDDAISRVRNLKTYEVVSRAELEKNYDPSLEFSPERWSAFKHDVEALSQYRRPKAWRNTFRDRGYNGTPLWTTIGAFLANRVPADSALLPWLCSLDFLFLGAAAALVAATFGSSKALLVFLLFAASPTNATRLIGGFMQYDWLCAIACSICFYKRRMQKSAAVFMAYAVMTRVFPIILVAGAMFPPIVHAIRTRRLPKRIRTYFVTGVLACLLGAFIGLANGRGVQGWIEFKEAISVHKGHHVLGDRRIGLEHAFTRDLTQLGTDVNKSERRENLDTQRPIFIAVAALMCVFFLIVGARVPSADAQLLSVVIVFALLVLSRYYYGWIALLPLLSGSLNRRMRVVTGGQVALFLLYYLSILEDANRHESYVTLNLLLTLYFFLLLVAHTRWTTILRNRPGVNHGESAR